MNRSFDAKSTTVRGFFACAAVFAALTIVASIDLLSRHYDAEAHFAAAARSITVAGNH